MKKITVLVFCAIINLCSGSTYWQDDPNYVADSLKKTYPITGMLTSGLKDETTCQLCRQLANLLIAERRLGMSPELITAEAYFVCSTFKIEEADVCAGILKSMVNVLVYIWDKENCNSTSYTERICALMLKCDAGDNFKWSIDVAEGETVERPVSDGQKTYKVLHITDLHYDPYYKAGKTKKCHRPLCCQSDQEDAKDAEDSCGQWGEYGFDLPKETMLQAFKNTQQHKFDYVYVTGDIVSHRVWSTSPESNKKAMQEVFDHFSKYYNVPVYPVIGNHEAHPVNQFPSINVTDASVSSNWLYEFVAEKWSKWLHSEQADDIAKGGYYSISPIPGLRVVVINNNVCVTENWWLIASDYDPYGQLTWLNEVLLSAEANKERVHLLAHVPTGTDYCISSWSHEFNRIVERFSNTIAAQFYGHAHKDELYVFYSQDNFTKPINVGYNGASLCPDKSNPSYKVFEIDSQTFDVVDYEEWTFNLTAANEDPTSQSLNWYKLYSFKDAYGVKDMSPESIDGLLQKMAKNHHLIEQYWRYVYRNGDVSLNKGCDTDCQKRLLCQMAYTDNTDKRRCNSLLSLYDEPHHGGSLTYFPSAGCSIFAAIIYTICNFVVY